MKRFSLLAMLLYGLALNYSWAERLEQPNVTYQKRPSGRIYGSDGSLVDPKPSFPNQVYDSDGRAYHSTIHTRPFESNTLGKPLPRATTPLGRSTGIRAAEGSLSR